MSDDAALLLAEAEEQIEAWLCELDAEWKQVLEDAREQAADIVSLAEAQAADLLAEAEADAADLRAIAAAQVRAAPDTVGPEDLAALAQAVERLRLELSRVVEAAFDALPAVEATAAALRSADAVLDTADVTVDDRFDVEDELEMEMGMDDDPFIDDEPVAVPRRRGLLARLTRRA